MMSTIPTWIWIAAIVVVGVPLVSIIQYDELDTTDRESIWERCRTWQRQA